MFLRKRKKHFIIIVSSAGDLPLWVAISSFKQRGVEGGMYEPSLRGCNYTRSSN